MYLGQPMKLWLGRGVPVDEGTLVAGRYEVRGRLARGGMADVLVAHDHRLRRDVALKVARATATTDRARFDAETRLLASLQHPHLVRMFDAGVHDGDPFLVLELADGPTLGALLCEGPVDEARLHTLGRDLAGALAHLHGRGIVHRDVKPANVLTAADGRWLLADFGIARLVDTTDLTDTGMAVGTPAYLAPERVTGGLASPATDVYALGQVLLESATGRPAFPGNWTEAARARLTQDPDVSAAPPAWRALLAAMTARDPQDRPTAAEVHERLTAGGPGGAVAPPTADTGEVPLVLLPTGPVVPLGVTAGAAPPVATSPDRSAGPLPADPMAATSSVALGGAAAEPDDGPDGAGADAGRRRSRPRLAAAAAVALVLLVGLAWLRLGSDAATASPPAAPTTSSVPPSSTVVGAAPPSTALAVAEAVATTVPPTTTTVVTTTVPPTTATSAVAAGAVAVVDCPVPTPTTVPVATTAPAPGADTAPERQPAVAPSQQQAEPATVDC